jgi:MFS family permease
MATETTTRTGGVLAATCLSTVVVDANTSVVSILLPAISADTGMSVDTLQWAVTGYSLMGAAVIVTSGSLGDVFGRNSAAAAAAHTHTLPTSATLVVARIAPDER